MTGSEHETVAAQRRSAGLQSARIRIGERRQDAWRRTAIRVRLTCLAVVAPMALGAASARAEGCSAERVGQARLTKDRAHYVIPVSVDGHPALPFLLDTGAVRTAIHVSAATSLNLPERPGRRSYAIGTDGSRGPSIPDVMAKRLEFAGAERVDLGMRVATELIDGKPAYMGVLGSDLLSGYDVELDFPRQRLTLYRVKGCNETNGSLRPWPTPYSAVPLKRSPEGTLSLPVVLDGKELELALDTGANRSKISMEAAAGLGLELDQLKAQAPHNLSKSATGGTMSNFAKRFARVQVGRSSYRNVEIKVSEIKVEPYDGLLGLDFLHSRKVWVSYATNQLFFEAR